MTQNATREIMMVRPVRFAMNAQTAVDNFYQQAQGQDLGEQAQEAALKEFDAFVAKLRVAGVRVHVVQDSVEPHTPDSIFPNNWISMHVDGRIALYPMKAENRRLERLPDIEARLSDWGFEVRGVEDYTEAEEAGIYLEGTGALIFDHDAGLVYMARSGRADEMLLEAVCEDFGYEPVVFSAFQDTTEGRQPIYHTNVMMAVTDTYVVICLDTIDDIAEREAVVAAIKGSGKDILEITEAQKHQFAGNMLLVQGAAGPILVMSSRAYRSLRADQIERIQRDHAILHSELTTIEDLGGGSARCMLAEIYLPKKGEE